MRNKKTIEEIDRESKKNEKEEWRLFLDKFAGCLADDPIERGDQGQFGVKSKK